MKKQILSILFIVSTLFTFIIKSDENNITEYDLNPLSAGPLSPENEKLVRDLIKKFGTVDYIFTSKSSLFVQHYNPAYKTLAINFTPRKELYFNEAFFNTLDAQEKEALVAYALMQLEEYSSEVPKLVLFGIFGGIAVYAIPFLTYFLLNENYPRLDDSAKFAISGLATILAAAGGIKLLWDYNTNYFIKLDKKLIKRISCREGLIKYLNRIKLDLEKKSLEESYEYKAIEKRLTALETV